MLPACALPASPAEALQLRRTCHAAGTCGLPLAPPSLPAGELVSIPRTPQPGRRLEFVINDGGNDWDKPSPWGGSKLSNYVVEEPGVYRLRNGKVTRLA